MALSSPPQQEVCGSVARITFQNEETGYTVAHLAQQEGSSTICVVGMMPAIHVGAAVICRGKWKQHPSYGEQFIVEEYELKQPADAAAIEKYLQSKLVSGIGPVYAKRIVAQFGSKTLEILDNSPDLLTTVPGLGKKRIAAIQEAWQTQRGIRDVMLFLQQQGITPAYAQKIFRRYGEHTIAKIKKNPYLLAEEIKGIGFILADQIARRMGIEVESPERIEAGILFRLGEQEQEGHVCYPLDAFLQETAAQLEVSIQLIENQLEDLRQKEQVVVYPLHYGSESTPFIWTAPLFLAEQGIAKELKRILCHSACLRAIDESRAVGWVQKELGLPLAAAQKQAVIQAFQNKVQIITGGPGTGKSTITHAILSITEKLSKKIILAAPTGRAAKRLSEITGYKASTIHSLLEYDFTNRRFKKNKQNPLDVDLLIVDEASMIDTLLMYQFLKAVPDTARLIFVGDIFQLPSVGPGNVLKDLIASHQIPVTALQEIFRQAAGSKIITNAHRINKGQFPDLQISKDSDFFFLEAEEPDAAADLIRQLVTVRLPVRYSLDPLQQIQVLTPMKKGILGTQSLNAMLQRALNPKSRGKIGQRFFAGDKVMQLRNNYSKEVFNGDVGIVQEATEETLTMQIDERLVSYLSSEFDELTLAYAVSVHKYQGSECPCVVIPVHTTHFKLLHRNLLYTAVTRGKKLVILVGMAKAIGIAVRNDEVKKRYTGLQQALAKSRRW